MLNNLKTGFYGKLPSNGDFLSRNLSHDITLNIDEWFQVSMTQLRHRLPDWSYFFNASPSWFFIIPCNFFSSKAYAGYITPSIDRVGRCFPLIVLKEINADHIADVNALEHWYVTTEEIVRNCLRNSLSADELMVTLDKTMLMPGVFKKEEQSHVAKPQNDILDVLFANIDQTPTLDDSGLSGKTSSALSKYALPEFINSFQIFSTKSHWWHHDKLTNQQNKITHEGLHSAALFTRLFVNA
jgi:type VI secretion system ImpM family protein